MTYRVTGAGMIPKLSAFSTMAQAADLARRMTFEGVQDVFVFDALGREISLEGGPGSPRQLIKKK